MYLAQTPSNSNRGKTCLKANDERTRDRTSESPMEMAASFRLRVREAAERILRFRSLPTMSLSAFADPNASEPDQLVCWQNRLLPEASQNDWSNTQSLHQLKVRRLFFPSGRVEQTESVNFTTMRSADTLATLFASTGLCGRDSTAGHSHALGGFRCVHIDALSGIDCFKF